jgi:hypothetical protein
MTCRSKLQKSAWKANLLAWGGITIFVSSFFILSATQSSLSYVSLALSVGCFLGGMMYADRFGLRCPACDNSLYLFLMIRPGYGWWLSNSVQACPYCSHDFDKKWTEDTRIILPATSNEIPDLSPANSISLPERGTEPVDHGMTGRELIRERGHTSRILFRTGIGLCLAGFLLIVITHNNVWLILFLSGIPLICCADFHNNTTVLRCPWCHHSLSNMATKQSGGLPEEIRVCPHCTKRFDEPVTNRIATTQKLPNYPEHDC